MSTRHSDRRPPDVADAAERRAGFCVAVLADELDLPEELLRSFGVTDACVPARSRDLVVHVPFFDESARVQGARIWTSAGTKWKSTVGKLTVYGLQFIDQIHNDGRV